MDELISRQTAIDQILRLTHYDTVRSLYEATVANKYEDCYEDGIIDAIDVIVGLTSPQPDRKTGRWVDYPIADGCLQCSVCGILRLGDASNFCPNCGARMEEDDG